MDIPETLRKRRESLGMSRDDLAKAAGCTRQNVAKIETTGAKWADWLGMALDELGLEIRAKPNTEPDRT